MSQNIPRHHHFVPHFYLAGFTPAGTKDDMLVVHDLRTGRQRPSKPGNTGSERDFYMLEVEEDQNFDAVAIERLFGQIEDRGAHAVRLIAETGELPSGEDYEKLIDFMAIMAVRGPGVLKIIDEFHENVIKSIAHEVTAANEGWDSIVSDLRAEGKKIDKSDWEGIRKFIESGQYRASLNQNFRMGVVLEMLKPTFGLLASRKWTILRAPADGPAFICSDRPLSVRWTDPAKMGGLSPAPGMFGTSVLFPLNKSLALIGMFEGNLPPRQVTAHEIAFFNTWTALFADRYLYTAQPDFAVIANDGAVGGKSELMERLADKKGPPLIP